MSKSKIFVFAATGDQGFSTCRYLLEDGGFDVVGLSRNPESEKSKGILPFVLFALLEWSLIDGGTAELTNMGVKVVKGDLENVSSYAQHLEGMDGAFINADCEWYLLPLLDLADRDAVWAKYYTNGFDAPAAGKYEETCSRSATDACVKAGVKHMVYSTLEDIPDKLTCEHLNSKARGLSSFLAHHFASWYRAVTKYMEENKLPVTQLYTSTYYSNVTKFYQLEKKDDGSFLLTTPIPDDCGLVIFAVEQTGLWVRAAFKDPAKWIGSLSLLHLVLITRKQMQTADGRLL
jgi:hypothetical protein